MTTTIETPQRMQGGQGVYCWFGEESWSRNCRLTGICQNIVGSNLRNHGRNGQKTRGQTKDFGPPKDFGPL